MKRLKGLFRDCKPIDQPQGTYRNAENMLFDKEQGAIVSEEGNIEVDAIPTGFTIIGKTQVVDGRIILFLANGTDSKIAQFDTNNDDPNDNPYTEIIDNIDLNFDPNSRIEATTRVNDKDEIIVYWTDDINSPRALNIDNLPSPLTNVNDLNVFDFVEEPPVIDLEEVNNSGGVLNTGAFYFFISYIDNVGNRTSFMSTSNPIYVTDDVNLNNPDNYDGAPGGTPTSKSITLSITDIDTSFRSVQIAVVKKEGGVFQTPRLLPEVPIGTNNLRYTYTGSESFTETSLDEIFIDNASYKTAKTMTQIDDVLYMGNLTDTPDVGYQKYANNIKVNVGRDTLEGAFGSGENSYKNPQVCFDMKTYQRDAVYAFYISLILNDGTETEAYHIPGRTSNTGETNNASGTEEDIIDPDAKNFHFNNNPDTRYNTGYWENENEKYPAEGEDWEIWDVDSNGDGQPTGNDLHNSPVRHHRMPGHNDEPIYEDYIGDYYLLKVRLEDVKIPSDIADQVSAIKVYYAKRDGVNKRIVGQSLINGSSLISKNGNNLRSVEAESVTGASAGSSGDEGACWSMPFSMMLNRPNVGQLSHIRTLYTPYGNPSEITGSTRSEIEEFFPLNNRYFTDINNWALQASAFMPNAQDEVELISKGFDNDGYSKYSESSLMMEFVNNQRFSWGLDDNGDGFEEYGFIANMMAHKTELYNSFDLQELVWTGFIDDASNYNPENWQTSENEIHIQQNIAGSSVANIVEEEQFSDNFAVEGIDKLTVDNWYKVKCYFYTGEKADNTINIDIDTGDAGTYGTTIVSSGLTGSISYGTEYAYSFQNTAGDPDIKVTIDGTAIADIDGAKVIVEEYSTDPGVSIYQPYCIGINQGYNSDYTDLIFAPFEEGDTSDELYTKFESYLNRNPNISNDYTISKTDDGSGGDIVNIDSVNKGSQYNLTFDLLSIGGDDEANLAFNEATNTAGSTTQKDIFGGDTYINRYGHRVSFEGGGGSIRSMVLDFVCESTDNIEYRQSGDEYEQVYYPKVSAEELIELEEQDSEPDDEVWYDNYYAYNQDYSLLQDLKTAVPFSKSVVEEITNLNTRIIRSQKFEVNQEGDGFRRFLENDYIDLPKNRGELVKLSVFDNILMPHMERSLLRTKGREELVTGDIRAYIGSGDIFSVKPDEIAYTEDGFGGLQDPETAVVTPFGYFFVDRGSNRVFLMSEGLSPISEKGMSNFFEEELKDAPSDKLQATWDDRWNRIILTYEDKWTISYSPRLESWVSFHSYDPDKYFSGLTNYYSINNDKIYRHNEETKTGEYYGTLQDSVFEFIENRQPTVSKIFTSLRFITEVRDQNDNYLTTETFDQFRVSNDRQDSGDQDIVHFTEPDGNARNVEGTWQINKFRDMLDDQGNIDLNKPWYEQARFISKYLRVKLIFNNTANKSLYLYDTNVRARKSNR